MTPSQGSNKIRRNPSEKIVHVDQKENPRKAISNIMAIMLATIDKSRFLR